MPPSLQVPADQFQIVTHDPPPLPPVSYSPGSINATPSTAMLTEHADKCTTIQISLQRTPQDYFIVRATRPPIIRKLTNRCCAPFPVPEVPELKRFRGTGFGRRYRREPRTTSMRFQDANDER